MIFWNKLKSKEYLSLKQELEDLKIEVKSLNLELDLILSKLKFKYKIRKSDLKEEEPEKDLSKRMLLPDY